METPFGQKQPASGLYVDMTTGTVQSGHIHFRNRIINGDMRIDQRNAGTAVTTNAAFGPDRFYQSFIVSAGTVSMQQFDAPANTMGFVKAIRFAGGSAATANANNYIMIRQNIEGYNIADLMWGSANAQTVTVSFWVYASETPTYTLFLRNGDNSRRYVKNFTITAATSWQRIVITVPGCLDGTWLNNNGLGIQVGICFGAGSDSTTASEGSWGAGAHVATASTSQLGSTVIYIAGVQFEKGTVATPFDFRPYAFELQQCQRYFETSFPVGTVPAANIATDEIIFTTGAIGGGGTEYGTIPWKVPKRIGTGSTLNLYNTRAAVAVNTSLRIPGTGNTNNNINMSSTWTTTIGGFIAMAYLNSALYAHYAHYTVEAEF